MLHYRLLTPALPASSRYGFIDLQYLQEESRRQHIAFLFASRPFNGGTYRSVSSGLLEMRKALSAGPTPRAFACCRCGLHKITGKVLTAGCKIFLPHQVLVELQGKGHSKARNHSCTDRLW